MNGLKELSLEEMHRLSGGSFWAGVAVSLAAAFMYEVVNDWQNNVKAFKEGYASFE